MPTKASNFQRLMGRYPGVPYTRTPLYWDTRLPIMTNVQVVEQYISEWSRLLPTDKHVIDEAAIMVPNREARGLLERDLGMAGWEPFNVAADIVHTNPLDTRYVVEYSFLRHPRRAWRLEVMLLGEQTMDGQTGFSPLHQSLWFPSGLTPDAAEWPELPVPHLSFKPLASAVAELGAEKAVRRDVDYLTERGWLIAQACQSTYGQFWYLAKNDGYKSLYLKPRINLRDGGEG